MEDQRWVGGYRLIRRLGQGAAGSVWEAADGGGDRVALKLMHAAVAAEQESRDRLVREAALISRIKCPGVVQVLDIEVDGEEVFMVTELVDGITLAEDIKEHGPYSAGELAVLAEKVASILVAVHEAGVVHRDLKPSNVMLGTDGPMLIDFGISRAAGEAQITRTGMITGTPGFVPPEVLSGADPGESADWWAWAGMILQAATGRPPYAGDTWQIVLARVASGTVDVEGLPPKLSNILTAALAVDPATRPNPAQVLSVLADAADVHPEIPLGVPGAAGSLTQVVPFAGGLSVNVPAVQPAYVRGTEFLGEGADEPVNIDHTRFDGAGQGFTAGAAGGSGGQTQVLAGMNGTPVQVHIGQGAYDISLKSGSEPTPALLDATRKFDAGAGQYSGFPLPPSYAPSGFEVPFPPLAEDSSTSVLPHLGEQIGYPPASYPGGFTAGGSNGYPQGGPHLGGPYVATGGVGNQGYYQDPYGTGQGGTPGDGVGSPYAYYQGQLQQNYAEYQGLGSAGLPSAHLMGALLCALGAVPVAYFGFPALFTFVLITVFFAVVGRIHNSLHTRGSLGGALIKTPWYVVSSVFMLAPGYGLAAISYVILWAVFYLGTAKEINRQLFETLGRYLSEGVVPAQFPITVVWLVVFVSALIVWASPLSYPLREGVAATVHKAAPTKQLRLVITLLFLVIAILAVFWVGLAGPRV